MLLELMRSEGLIVSQGISRLHIDPPAHAHMSYGQGWRGLRAPQQGLPMQGPCFISNKCKENQERSGSLRKRLFWKLVEVSHFDQIAKTNPPSLYAYSEKREYAGIEN